jgi:5'-nucleotidase
LGNNYVSVVPCQYDMTAYQTIKLMQEWQFN